MRPAGLRGVSPVRLAAELSHLPGLIFLDSSTAGGEPGGGSGPGDGAARFSLVAARPKAILRGALSCDQDYEKLSEHLARRRIPEDAAPDLGLPGPGLYGAIDYEGDFLFGEYDEVVVHDHATGRWWETGELSSQRIERSEGARGPLVFEDSLSRESYCEMVERARAYIAAGDIYQVNLSHRFGAARPPDFDLFALYRRLREVSPAPFSAYLDLGRRTVLSSSPEEFLRLSGRSIRTRPIKGTRPRYRDLERDERSAYDLITSPKEIAELVMITDLERNDLGQVCEFGSVVATELLKLERFAQVFHLVSTVEGTLRAEVDHIAALRACFPGGSITGAPKKRAREIIAELEPSPRGLYTGAIGGFGFHGESHFNIVIRSLVAEDDELHFHVGAGIVADSVPAKEWDETLDKAAGILRACT